MRSIDKAESRKDALFILDSEQSRVTGNGSCNKFFGTYVVKAGDSDLLWQEHGFDDDGLPRHEHGDNADGAFPSG